MPPPGAYIPPNQGQSTPPQGYGTQQQQQGYQQPSAQGHGQVNQSQKGGGGTFGQMMNQAVTTSKPMLNKLSKTISSKLGNKPSTPGTPQHLQSYQNYQQHYGQQTQPLGQPQSHTYNPQAQQSQHQPPAPNAYPPQQSPYQQPNYGSSQGNYFAQQAPSIPQAPYTQATPPPPQPSQTNYNGNQLGQGINTSGGQDTHSQQGQFQQGQTSQYQQQQPLQTQYTGQQMGVVGSSQHSGQSSYPQSPQPQTASPQSPAPQQPQWNNPTAYQQQPQVSNASPQSYFQTTNVPTPPNNQQWTPMSPTGSERQGHTQLPPASISPPPPPMQSKPTTMSSPSPLQSHTSTPAPRTAAVSAHPTEFIAELPADLGNLSIAEVRPSEHAPAQPSGQASPYQAYQSPGAQPAPSSPSFNIARRAVSISNVPFADPWRFADPLTELPTREFYVIADLLYDALDRKFEPQNTGMLEASKILRSWIDLTEDAIRKCFCVPKHGVHADHLQELFSYDTYHAFGKMWSLQGIPHVMVPCQPLLSPVWNFNQHSHAQELKLSAVPAHGRSYATYMPALNRAGWYKFFFLEMMHGPDNINKLMPALCSETYNPEVLHHPNLATRDKAEAPALQARAAEIQTTTINQVCNETKAAMLAAPHI